MSAPPAIRNHIEQEVQQDVETPADQRRVARLYVVDPADPERLEAGVVDVPVGRDDHPDHEDPFGHHHGAEQRDGHEGEPVRIQFEDLAVPVTAEEHQHEVRHDERADEDFGGRIDVAEHMDRLIGEGCAGDHDPQCQREEGSENEEEAVVQGADNVAGARSCAHDRPGGAGPHRSGRRDRRPAFSCVRCSTHCTQQARLCVAVGGCQACQHAANRHAAISSDGSPSRPALCHRR